MDKIKLSLSIEGFTPEEIANYEEILVALVRSGGLGGVRGGQTIIHFDGEGQFMGVQLSYWPFRKRKKTF